MKGIVQEICFISINSFVQQCKLLNFHFYAHHIYWMLSGGMGSSSARGKGALCCSCLLLFRLARSDLPDPRFWYTGALLDHQQYQSNSLTCVGVCTDRCIPCCRAAIKSVLCTALQFSRLKWTHVEEVMFVRLLREFLKMCTKDSMT